MPTPRKNEKEKDFIERCIPIVIREDGIKDSKQAYAVCKSMYVKSRGKE